MDVLARFALPGILALSAIGALIVGVLLLRYGSVAPEEEDVDDVEHRVTVTRMAHAFVAMCLAGIAVLAAAALVARPAAPARTALAGLTPAGSETPTTTPDARPGTREAPETPLAPAASPDTPAAPDESRASAERPDAAEPAPSARTEAPGHGVAASAGAPARGRDTATSALQAPTTPSPRTPAGALAADGRPADRESPAREEEVRRLRQQVAALEERLDRREAASRAPALSSPAELQAELPPRSAPPRSTSPRRAEPPATAAAIAEDRAAPPVTVGKPQITTTIQGVRVDVHRQPGGGDDTIYTIRLAAPGDRPLTGADVSLLGRDRDGLPVRAALVPAGEPGLYRARVAARSAADLRLRVVHESARFEVSLDRPVRW